jgi:hypothetical protein
MAEWAKSLPTYEDLHAAFIYNAATGELRWRVKPRANIDAGAEVGFINENGYRIVKYRNEAYKAHRIIWKMVFDEEPPRLLDHWNTIKCDNRLFNLRPATKAQNARNSKVAHHCQTQLKGVYKIKNRDKYVAMIRKDWVQRYLGVFDTAEAASAAYITAAKELHGEFANDGASCLSI